MRLTLGIILLSFLFSGFSASAKSSAELRRLFPAKCPGDSRAAVVFAPDIAQKPDNPSEYVVSMHLQPLVCMPHQNKFMHYKLQSHEYVVMHKDDIRQFWPTEYEFGNAERITQDLTKLETEQLRELVGEIFKVIGIHPKHFKKTKRATLLKLVRRALHVVGKEGSLTSYYALDTVIDLKDLLNSSEKRRMKDGQVVQVVMNMTVGLGRVKIPVRMIIQFYGNKKAKILMGQVL